MLANFQKNLKKWHSQGRKKMIHEEEKTRINKSCDLVPLNDHISPIVGGASSRNSIQILHLYISSTMCTLDGAMCMLGAHWGCSVHARWSNVHVRVHIGAAVCTQDGAMCMLGAHWSSSVHARWSNVHVRCTLELQCAR